MGYLLEVAGLECLFQAERGDRTLKGGSLTEERNPKTLTLATWSRYPYYEVNTSKPDQISQHSLRSELD